MIWFDLKLENFVTYSGPTTKAPPALDDEILPWVEPGVDGANLAFENFMTFRMMRLAIGMQRIITRPYLMEFDISLPEWRLLTMLSRQSSIPFSALSSRSRMDKAQVSRALRSLVSSGLAESRTDPENKRRIIVSITDAGHAMFQKILPTAKRNQMRLLDVLTVDERIALFRILDKLAEEVGVTLDPRKNPDSEAIL